MMVQKFMSLASYMYLENKKNDNYPKIKPFKKPVIYNFAVENYVLYLHK